MIRWIEMDVPNKNYIVTKILYQDLCNYIRITSRPLHATDLNLTLLR